MRPFTSVIPLTEARRRLEQTVCPIERTERVALADCPGRVAAATVRSPIDVPPFARSAMDGYAVIAADTLGATNARAHSLRVIERLLTGQTPRSTLIPGTCAEIATGAPLPAGADAVVMVEVTERAGDGETVLIRAEVASGQHVSLKGADIACGALVIRAGELLTASRTGALAAIGATDADVYQRPRVAIFSTGDEVAEPGESLRPGQIYDVNRFTLGAIVAAHGGIPEFHPPARDTIESLTDALQRSSTADIIVFSGGSSVGERDLIVDLIETRGELVFHGIAIKPGMPTLFARMGPAAFFGMPGNPTSCLSNAYVLLIPFLRACARLPPAVPRKVRAPLAQAIRSAPGRHQFYTVKLEAGRAVPVFKGSGDITSLSQADGYVEVAAEATAVEEDTVVDVTLY